MAILSVFVAPFLTTDPTGSPPSRDRISVSYTAHSIISINGDSALVSKASAEGWTGDGSSSNPFIIDGYDIDGSGFLSAILIGNTTLHLRIQNCYLHNSVCGIFFYNVKNGTVVNDFFELDSVGVKMTASGLSSITGNNGSALDLQVINGDNITVQDNNCSYGGYIDVSGTSIVVRNNTCSHSSGIAAGGPSCRNITISRNICRFDSRGISCMFASGVSILNNTLTDNTIAGVYSENGYPTIRGNDCSRSATGILINAGGATITDNNCSDTAEAGIDYSGISGTILRNNCSGSTNGIEAFAIAATSVIISNNFCSYNSLAGINVSGLSLDSARGTIGNNTCIGNSQSGIHVSHYGGLILNNTCHMNGYNGLLLQHSSSVIRENTLTANGMFGMWFSYAYNLMDGYRYSTFDAISSNSVTDNLYGGIVLDRTDHETLTGNVFSANSRLGLVISDSTYVTMRDNMMTGEGVFMYGSTIARWCLHDIDSSNLVNGKPIFYLVNAIEGTVPAGQGQVILGNCRNVLVQDQILNNASVGVSLGYCRSINVTYTYCSGGIFGMNLNSSRGCWIHENEIKNNSNYGINLSGGSANILWNNTFYGNNLATSVYSPSHVQARDDTGANLWNNAFRGNWWNDWQSPDSNMDGIVDVPYAIDGGAGAMDNLPLTSPVIIPEFGGLATIALACMLAVLSFARSRRVRR